MVLSHISPLSFLHKILDIPLPINELTRSTALSPAFEGGDRKRRSGSTLSKPRHLSRGADGLTLNLYSIYNLTAG